MNNISKLRILIFVPLTSLLILSILFITGCDQTSGKPKLRIAIWGGTDEIDMINSIVDEWQKNHPEVEAKVEHTPAGSYTNKLLIRIAGGTAPDVMFVEANIFVNFWAMDAPSDMSPSALALS